MGMMSPVFRELNFGRITELKAGDLSDSTVARIISDETGQKVTAQDVRGYLKLNTMGSEQMLVSKKVMRAITGNDPEEPEPESA